MLRLLAICLGLSFLALNALGQASTATPLTIRFPTVAQGQAALTQGAEAGYFDTLQLADLRAKTGLLLAGATLTEARVKARAKFAEEVVAFTPTEQAMLRAVLARLAPKLEADFPLMARTPFSFIKAGTGVEAGIPHTRGVHIVLSPLELDSMVWVYRLGWDTILDQMLAPLLVHEQTHVLQRAHPERFAPFYSDVLGFKRLNSVPDHPWLIERRVVNPDATDLRWAFRFTQAGQTRWIRPDILLKVVDRPRMVDDYRMVGVELIEQEGTMRVAVDAGGQPMTQDLKSIHAYRDQFPNPANIHHPSEVAADLIAGWVSGHPEGGAKHPLRAKIGPWVRANLQ